MESFPSRFSFSTFGCAPGPAPWRRRIEKGRGFGFGSFHLSSPQITFARDALSDLARDRVETSVVTLESPDPLRLDNVTHGAWLAAANSDLRSEALRATIASVEEAARCGVRVVIVRPGLIPVFDGPQHHVAAIDDLARGRTPTNDPAAAIEEARAHEEPALDRTCRSLFELCRRFPEVTFCLAAGSTYYEIPQLPHVEWILSDVAARNLGYWHEPARCRALESFGASSQAEWLEARQGRMIGLTFEDALATGDRVLPEAGSVDLAMLGDYAGAGQRVTLRVAEDWADEAVRHTIDCLAKYGVSPRVVNS